MNGQLFIHYSFAYNFVKANLHSNVAAKSHSESFVSIVGAKPRSESFVSIVGAKPRSEVIASTVGAKPRSVAFSLYCGDVDDTQLAFREHSNAITESDINYITLTPNPSSGRFLVQLLNTDDAISQIMVFNFYGQLISCEGKQLNNHDYLLNLKGYSPGVYYVNVKLTSSKEIVKKLTLVNEK